MSGPSKSGVFIYSSDVATLSSFYTDLLEDARIVFSNHEMAVINVPDGQLVIHAPDAGIHLTESESRYRENAIKPFFTVGNIDTAKNRILERGGTAEQMIYRGPYFNVCNVSDPEGNVFMIREFF
jgi:predicted enzyme related to lactoylglutathione lyase